MVSIRPSLEIINVDLDREQGLVSSKIEDSSTAATKNDLIQRKPNGTKTNKWRICDPNHNMFEMERGDSEVVKAFKKSVKTIFLPAIFMLGVRLNYIWRPQKYFMFWITILIVITIAISMCYTHYLHTAKGDAIRNLEVFAIYGFCLSNAMKLTNYIYHFKSILAFLHFMLKICRQNPMGRRAELLKNELRKSFSNLKIFTICVLANCGLFLLAPIIGYLVKEELIVLVPLEFPFIDQSTMFGYLTANGIFSLGGVLATSGTVVFASIYIFLISSYSAQVELIGNDFEQLDQMWADKTESLNCKRLFLRNICMRCQDMDSYIAGVKSVFDLKMFAFFSLAYISQIICLFEIAKNDWIPGFPIAFLLFEEIMFYCYVGTKKSTANEKLCAIICSTNWYEYDLSSQKLILSQLQSCKNSSELEIGPLAPMNLMTGVQIVKSIYSYYAVLMELL